MCLDIFSLIHYFCMGITANCAKFLLYARTQGVDFSHTVMLGRQQLFLSPIEKEKLERKIQAVLPDGNSFAEPFFTGVGAKKIESIDYSDFEGATIKHNMNDMISPDHFNRYSLLFDGGTLEHIFNFPIAIKNCMNMLKVGGHFVAITPSNNYSGHGFYQFSPELFFSLFTPAHGFNLKLVAMGVELPSKGITEWFKVKDPKRAGARVTIINSFPTSLMVIAEKIRATEELPLKPFQSDYQHFWEVHDAINNDVQREGEKKWIHHYRRRTPEFIKKLIRRIRGLQDKQGNIDRLGNVNPSFFTRMDVDDNV